jgi:hypothetical protein
MRIETLCLLSALLLCLEMHSFILRGVELRSHFMICFIAMHLVVPMRVTVLSKLESIAAPSKPRSCSFAQQLKASPSETIEILRGKIIRHICCDGYEVLDLRTKCAVCTDNFIPRQTFYLILLIVCLNLASIQTSLSCDVNIGNLFRKHSKLNDLRNF